MKAVVLAGGSGTRLRPFTHSTPKQLIPVANKPVLHYGLESLRDAGVTQVAIVVGDRGDEIRASAGDGSRFGLDLVYVRQDRPLGLAHAVMTATDFLGDDDFIVYLGDNVVFGGISPALDLFRESGADAVVMVCKVPDPREFGVVECDDAGIVTSLVEKPEHPVSDLALTGVYVFSPSVHSVLAGLRPGWRGEFELTDALSVLVQGGRKVAGCRADGTWKDTGRVGDLLDCNRLALRDLRSDIRGKVSRDCQTLGPVEIAPGARVSGSRLVGPVSIGPGARVSNSFVGPYTALGADCDVDECEIQDSIVLDGAVLRGARGLRESVIGRGATVDREGGPVTGRRLVLGDHSEVRIG